MINIITTVAGRKTSSAVMGLGRCLSSVTGATSAANVARSSSRYHNHIKLQSFAFSSTSSSSKSNDPNSSVDDSNDENPPPPSSSSPRPPMPLFPWRHEATPLPRLVEGTPEYTSLGPMLTSIRKLVPGNARLNSALSAFMFLDVPWYEILWLSHFEADLSDNISWAFAKGVGDLLCLLPLKSSLTNDEGGGTGYSGSSSNNNSDKELGLVDFHHTINLIDAATESVEAIGKAAVPAENDSEITSNSCVSDNLRETLKTMFEEKMIEYYLSAKDNALAELLTSGSASSATTNSTSSDSAVNDDSDTTFDPKDEQIEFRLLMEPYQSELISLYSIPYMSRKLGTDDPNYLISYRNMLSKPSRERAPDLSMLRSEYLDGQGRMESTVIAQVVVWCHEIFYVKHLASGKILQGQEVMYSSSNNSRQEHNSSQDHTANDDDKNVNSNSEDIHQVRQRIPHLVRMEKTVITFKDAITGAYANSQGDWMITDIDDILGGNFVV